MSLSTTFSTARSALAVSSAMSSVTSRNIAGAGEADYSQKRVVVTTGSSGLRQVGIERSADEAVRRNLLDATARASAADQVSQGYTKISQALNLGSDHASVVARIGDLEASIQTASSDPRNLAGLQGVVESAGRVSKALNSSYAGVRQIQADSDKAIESSVVKINALLADFADIQGLLSRDRGSAVDISELEDRRDVVLGALATEVGITTAQGSDGSLSIFASGGAVLYSGGARSVQFTPTQDFESGALGGAVFIDGVNVTGPGKSMSVLSGKLAGAIQTRDVVVPQTLLQLDQIALSLVSAFSEEAVNDNSQAPRLAGLFSFGQNFLLTGAEPVSDASKFITVNSNVDPSRGGLLTRLRDGGISAPGDIRYSRNPSGAADYAGVLIEKLGDMASRRPVDQSLGFGSELTVSELGQGVLSALGAKVVNSENEAAQLNVTADGFAAFLSNATGVNLDDELSRLLQIENSYRATTKIISAVDSLYQSLFDAVR